MSWDKLELQVLVKLGSIVVHAKEAVSEGGHEFDVAAIRTLLSDADVERWIREGQRRGLLPIERRPG